MKVSSLKDIKLGKCCPICASTDAYKVYVNGGVCSSANHNGKDWNFFYSGGGKHVQMVEVIEDTSSISFDFEGNKLKVTFPDSEDINLPLFDMEIDNVSIRAVKEILVFV